MSNTLNDNITRALNTLASKISITVTPDEALKFTQAALNLAHTAAVLHQTAKQ